MEKTNKKLLKKLNDIDVTTQVFIYDWFYTIYTRAFDIKVVRAVWDIILVFGDFYFLSFGVALFGLMEEDLMNGNIEDGFNFIRVMTNKLPLSKMVKAVLGRWVSPSKFDMMVTQDILKFEQEGDNDDELSDKDLDDSNKEIF